MIFDFYNNFGALNSPPIFEAFKLGLEKHGHKVTHHSGNGDVAVIWSVLWYGRMSANFPIWQKYRNQNKPVIVLEVGALRRDITWKIGLNGINLGSYIINGNKDNSRINSFGLKLNDWHQGNNIIICGQHDKSHQWNDNKPMDQWVTNTVNELRKHTTRPIKLRPHPRCPIRNVTNVKIDTSMPFREELDDAWAVINWNSNPGIESIIHGVPAFVGPTSLASPVANLQLSQIENPIRPDRQQWFNNLAWTEWTADEMSTGIPQEYIIASF
jgi:hypothetical protein